MVDKINSLLDKILGKLHILKFREQILYIIVGGGTTVVDWAVFALFVLFVPSVGGEFLREISPNILAYAVAWFCAVVFAYVLSRLFVFERTGERIATQFLKFLSSRVLTLVISIVFDVFLSGEKFGLGWNGFGVKLISSVFVIILNYITGKWLVFNKKRKEKARPEDKTEND